MAKDINKFTPDSNTPNKMAKELWTISNNDLVARSGSNENGKAISEINLGKLKSIIENTSSAVNDAKGIMEILPDLGLVEEILISSILSPKDLEDPEINISVSRDAPLGASDIIKEHFSTVYDLNSKLFNILAKSLFKEGAVPLLLIPPQVISNMIASNTISLDSIQEDSPMDLFVNTGSSISIEGMGGLLSSENNIDITDDFSILSSSYIQDRLSENNLKSVMMDNFGYTGDKEEKGSKKDKKEGTLYKKRKTLQIETQELYIDDEEISNELNPVIMELPMESVIPILTPGDPSNHAGYFVAVDGSGFPINHGKDSSYFKDLNARLEVLAAENVSGTTATVSTNLKGKKVSVSKDIVKPLMEAYSVKFEEKLKKSLKTTSGNSVVEVSAPESLYRVLLSRQLSNQKTKMIYVPKELMTYVAFDHNQFGIGVSLLEKTKLYSSLRAIVLFSTILADVRGSVPTKKLTITLDELDKDPQKTIETIVTEFATLQGGELPIGQLSPYDIVNGIQKAGIQVVIDGGEVFPSTAVELEEESRDVPKPSEDLSEYLKRVHYSGLWVSPEHVDRSLEGDFATGIVASDLIASKRHLKTQKMYSKMLSDFIIKYIKAGGPIRAKLEELFKEDNISFHKFIDSIEVTLPKPTEAAHNAQMESFTVFSEFIEIALESYISPDNFDGLADGDHIDSAIEGVKNTILSHFKRQFLGIQGMLPELTDFFNDEEGVMKDNINEHNGVVIGILESMLEKFITKEKGADRKLKKLKEKIDAKNEKEDEEEEQRDEEVDEEVE